MSRRHRAAAAAALAALTFALGPLGAGCGTPAAGSPGLVTNDADGGALATSEAGQALTDGDTDAPRSSPESGADAGPSVDTIFKVDVPNVVRRADIVLTTANVAPKDSVALGDGTLGVAVWAANGFTAQLNRGDTFPDRKSLGQVVIPGLAALATATDFRGHVDLYDAMLLESGGGMTATTFVRADAPELVVDVTGADPASTQVAKIQLWSGRSPAGLASGGIATLSETWQDASGMGASNLTFGSLAAVTVGARNVIASVVDPLTVQVTFQPNADGSFRVVIAAPTWAGGDAAATAASTLGSDATTPSADLRAAHLAFWHAYWSRIGLVEMSSADKAADYFEAMRTVYLYMAAAESRGTLPGSQAGLADLFDYLQDAQPWFPAAYWFWNTRMLVAANMTSGAFELNASVFHLYQSNLANIEAWTKSKMGGRPGICVPETMRFNGNGYWVGGESNSSCDESASPSYNALTITSGAEVGLWVWQHYLMTGDRAFLATNYPLMSESAQFLLAYAAQGADGLLHTVANAHETQWDVQDPVTDIVAMRALFTAVVSAAKVLATDAALAAQLQAALTKLPPLPRTDAASHAKLLSPSDDDAGLDVLALSYAPSASKHNGENLDLEAVWPYGLIGDTGPDTALARRTYQARMSVHGADWSFDALQAARLGLADEVRADLTAVTESDQTFIDGTALLGGGTNDGTSEPYVEQLGVTAAAINEALVQDYDGLLRLGPAWPQAWDAAGTVFIQGSSKVDVQIKAGVVVIAIVEAGSSGAIQVRNPWTGSGTNGSAMVLDGALGTTAVAPTTASTFTIPTVEGRWYAIVPAGTASLPVVFVTGTPADAPKTLGQVHLGK